MSRKPRKQYSAQEKVAILRERLVEGKPLSEVCRKDARLAYVIGNSKFYENPLPSDEILAAIFGHFGFELDRIDRMRNRQRKTGLYEAVVFMHRT